MKEDFDYSIFYDGFRTLTHNCLYNYIIGERGVGKTYWFKKWAIKDFILTGNQFGYIRRYKDELKESLDTFFDDILKEFPEHKFAVKGKKLYIDDKIAGYGFVLSTARSKKSVPFPFINKLCFDEFIVRKGEVRYLANDVEAFLGIYETIARPGSDHIDVIVFFLANAITWTNPYFLYFDIRKPTKRDKNNKLIWKNGEVLIELTDSEKFQDFKTKTRFGSIVKDTKYGNYSIKNEFLLDDDKFIEKKSKIAKYYFTFVYNEEKYGVWVDNIEGKMWVSDKIDPSYKLIYSLTMKDHSPNTMFMKSISKNLYFKTFIECYKLGSMYFETMNIKNICYDVIKMIMIS